MSKMIPQESIDAMRQHQNVSVDAFGIDCDLYIPSNLEALEPEDIYTTPADHTYVHYTTIVWIEWSPNMRRLRALGLFAENDLPILGKFQTKGKADDGTIRNIDILVKSYIKVPIQYVPDKYEKNDEFEIVDLLTGPVHDATLSKIFKLAPRRTR